MTGNGQPAIHRLRANHREWSPPQYIAIDTETMPAADSDGQYSALRCWSAQLTVRRTRDGDGTGTVTASGRTAEQLAAQIDHWCAGQKTMWVYAHNLSFDLAVTRIPVQLQALGWTVTAHAVSSQAPWLRMRRGRCVITFADSWGWLRAPLEQVATDLGMTKPALPGDSDSAQHWQARCDADTAILAEAMTQLMNWWDRRELGSWTLTGSAAGWNCYRHLSPGPLPLIVPGHDETALDRAAIYGGRREAFRHGQLDGGPWVLLDFKAAYPTIAASLPLPAGRAGDFPSLDLDSPVICGDSWGVIAEVDIDTDVPRFPVRAGGRVAYPVGRFTTTLAGPEIAEARRLGCLRRIGAGRMHKLSGHMQDWAQWILIAQDGQDSSVPAFARRTVKHWGRAVIGKFAAHGFITEPLATIGGHGWLAIPAWNAQYQAPSTLVEVCGQAAETIQAGDSENAYPAVLAWVEAWTRVYLNRTIEQLGRENVISCDTDGLIITADTAWENAVAAADTGAVTMRAKQQYSQLRVIGPQQMLWDGGRKIAGMPKTAVPTGEDTWTAVLWPKLAAQMSLRPGTSAAGYVRPERTYTLPQTTVTGYCRPDGTVSALHAASCPQGQLHLTLTAPGENQDADLENQAAHLKQMIRDLPPEGQPCSHHSSNSSGTDNGSGLSRPTTSRTSIRNPDIPEAAKDQSWPASGPSPGTRPAAASSGWTRMLSQIQTIFRICVRR